MDYIQTLVSNFLFRLQTMEFLDVLDVLLVTIALYLLIKILRRSRVALLLRGILTLGLILVLTTALLPLPTFDLFIGASLLAMLIITPIVLQPELRRFLERVGRNSGFSISERKDVAERVIPPLIWTVENLSKTGVGALIVLEGQVNLQDIAETGIAVNGRLTPELLQTIFFDKTPLHDGAVLIRDDQIEAAGCILPLTERSLVNFSRRLGTRHRSALGMSESSDALVVIVSEETGFVSIAQNGRFFYNLDGVNVRQKLTEFYTTPKDESSISLPKLFGVARLRQWRPQLPTFRSFIIEVAFWSLSFMLALLAATAVRAQENPLEDIIIDNVPLLVTDKGAESTLTTTIPDYVAVEAQTVSTLASNLNADSFRAEISLAGIDESSQTVPVEVVPLIANVRVLRVVPAQIDVEIAPLVSRIISVTVELEDMDQLSAAYEVVGTPLASPAEAIVSGPLPLVSSVRKVRASLSLANATTTVNVIRPLLALNERGNVVDNVTIEPIQAQIQVTVRRRVDARDVGVQVATFGSPPEGYWLSNLAVFPSGVTVQGNPNQIADMGNFVSTLPVDLSLISGEAELRVPLDLPGDVQAFGASGELLSNVTVNVIVAARTGDLPLTRTVDIVNDRGDFEIIVDPQRVELLLSGPLPTLNEVANNPDLVRVTIDALQLGPNETVEIKPTVILPDGIQVQLVQSSILVQTGDIGEDVQ